MNDRRPLAGAPSEAYAPRYATDKRSVAHQIGLHGVRLVPPASHPSPSSLSRGEAPRKQGPRRTTSSDLRYPSCAREGRERGRAVMADLSAHEPPAARLRNDATATPIAGMHSSPQRGECALALALPLAGTR